MQHFLHLHSATALSVCVCVRVCVRACAHMYVLGSVSVCVWLFAALQGKTNPLALTNLISEKKKKTKHILQQKPQLMYFYFFFLLPTILKKKTKLIFPICKTKNKTNKQKFKYLTPTNDPATLVTKFVLCFGSLLLTANCCAKKHLTTLSVSLLPTDTIIMQ